MYVGPAISGLLHLGLLALAFAPASPDPIQPVDSGPPVEVELLTLNEYNAALSRAPAVPQSEPPAETEAPETDVAIAPPETPAPPAPPPRPVEGVTISAPPEDEPIPEPEADEQPEPPVDVADAPPPLELDERALLDRAIERAEILPEDNVRIGAAPEPPEQPRGVFDAPEIATDPDEPPEPEPTVEPEPEPAPPTEVAEAEAVPQNDAPPLKAPLPRPKPRGSLAAESSEEELPVAVAPVEEVGEGALPPGDALDPDAERARRIAEELIARAREGRDTTAPTDEELEAERIAREDARIAEEDAREQAQAEREEAEEQAEAEREAAEELAEAERLVERERREAERLEAERLAEELAEAEAELAARRAAQELAEREEAERQAELEAERRRIEEERARMAAELERQRQEEAARMAQELQRQREAELRAQEEFRRQQEQARRAQAELERQRQAALEADQRRRQLEQFNAGSTLPRTTDRVLGVGTPSPAPAPGGASADPLMSMLTGAVGGSGSFDNRAFSRNVAAGGSAPPLTPGERQRLLAQLQRCWRVDHVSQQARQNVVVLRAQLRQNGFVDRGSIFLVSPQRSPSTQIAIEKAQNALLDTACQPFNLPPEKYASWQSIEIVFDPKNMVVQ